MIKTTLRLYDCLGLYHTVRSLLNELTISLTITFFTRMLFKDIFIKICRITVHRFYVSPIVMKFRFVNFLLNEYWLGLDETECSFDACPLQSVAPGSTTGRKSIRPSSTPAWSLQAESIRCSRITSSTQSRCDVRPGHTCAHVMMTSVIVSATTFITCMAFIKMASSVFLHSCSKSNYCN